MARMRSRSQSQSQSQSRKHCQLASQCLARAAAKEDVAVPEKLYEKK